MSQLNQVLKKVKVINYMAVGREYQNNKFNKEGKIKSNIYYTSTTKRSDIINYLIGSLNRKTTYLEIGVRNPSHNFDKIKANTKYSVDPGVEYKKNPVDFKMTSDEFFDNLEKNNVLSNTIKFDVIFIDGLHLAEQVDKDITNAMKFIKDDGFIVLHDCCPPTQWHAREEFYYDLTPAQSFWNGTTWKAFQKWRSKDVFSCCIDTDWGIGIISKTKQVGMPIKPVNEFYEFNALEKNKKEILNLISFEELKKLV